MTNDHVALHTIEICAGVGMLGEGLRAGLAHLGIAHRTVCYLEREAYAAAVLAARMEEGSLDGAPIWPDLLTFDGAAWRGAVDCIAAGFPCQDLSLAGRRAGLDGARSGLFFNILDIADDCGAQCLFLENVAGIASATATVVDEAEGPLEERAAARVLGELADRGWNAEWLTLSASDVGASHGRERWFCWAWRVGYTGLQHQHLQQRQDGAEHPGAGFKLAHPASGDRRQQPWPDQRGLPQPDGGIAQGATVGDSESIGNGSRRLQFGITQKLAKPTCRSTVLANPTGHGRNQGRPEPGGEQGRSDAAECGGAVADAECPCYRGEIEAANHRDAQAIGPADRTSGHSSAMADAGSPRLPQRIGGGQLCDQSTERDTRPDPEFHGCPLFAPGPADTRWPAIIAAQPWFTPALSIAAEQDAAAAFQATQPLLRGTPDGLAHGLDFGHRAPRLKCVGNGVVALCAAAAAVVLIRRSGAMTNQLLARVNSAQEAMKSVAEMAEA